MNADMLAAAALSIGFDHTAVISVDDLVFNHSFRHYCEDNVCGCYGANYSCPPDCGTPEEMENLIRKYKTAVVFCSKHKIPDFSDPAPILAAKRKHNDKMRELIRRSNLHGVMAGAGNCHLCETCAEVNHTPCKFPEERWSCLSAYCVDVAQLAATCGMEYFSSDGSVSFFGIFVF